MDTKYKYRARESNKEREIMHFLHVFFFINSRNFPTESRDNCALLMHFSNVRFQCIQKRVQLKFN